MKFEITDHVAGLSADELAALTAEAESGYDVSAQPGEPNPHFQRPQFVPEDLLDAIDARARQDGQSPEAVVRQALSAYLHTA